MNRLFLPAASIFIAVLGCGPRLEQPSPAAPQLKENIGFELSSVFAFAVDASRLQQDERRFSDLVSRESPPIQESAHRFYAFDAGGAFFRWTLTEPEGGDEGIRAIYPSQDWIFISTRSVSRDGKPCSTVFVRRSDGGLLCSDLELSPTSRPVYVYSTPDPNLFFVMVEHRLLRLELSGPEPVVTVLLAPMGPENGERFGWANAAQTNDAGDLAAFINVGTSDILRIYRADGSQQNLLMAPEGNMITRGRIGEPQAFYFSGLVAGERGFYRLAPGSDGKFEATLIHQRLPFPLFWPLLLRTEERLYTTTGAYVRTVAELVNGGTEPAVHPLGNWAHEGWGVGRQIRAWGKADFGGVYAFDLATFDVDTKTVVRHPDAANYFAPTIVETARSGAMSFVARRLSDAKVVLANLPVDGGAITDIELSAPDAPQIHYLKRLD